MQLANISTTQINIPKINIAKIKPTSDFDFIAKTIIIGEAGVGKSSILKRFTHKLFDFHSLSTIGIDFETAYMQASFENDTHNQPHSKHLGHPIPHTTTKTTRTRDTQTISNDINKYLTIDKQGLRKQIKRPVFKFQIWDCAGQERYHSIVHQYLRGANVIVLVFDITDRESFIRLNKWIETVKQHLGNANESQYVCIVVGNKLDKESNRQTTHTDGQLLADKLHTQYFEVSAKQNNNIEKLFHDITTILYKKMLNKQIYIPHSSIDKSVSFRIANTSSPIDEENAKRCIPCTII